MVRTYSNKISILPL